MSMSDAGEKKDATVQLPDEVLCHVFGFLSLKDKLRSEAVNRKFQRCVLQELKANPPPLEYNHFERQLNGYDIPPDRTFGAVQMLAKKAKFSSVSVFGVMPDCVQWLDSVLSLLMSEAQCLTKVTSFFTHSGCSQAVLENFLDKCDKLSSISLLFDVRAPNSESPLGESFPLDLTHLLKKRRLTELQLCPVLYPMKDLAQMFKQIQPNALRKLDLWFENEMGSTQPTLSMAELFDALVPNGSLLGEINLVLRYVDIRFAQLFESLARLPALRKCDIECEDLEGNGQVAQFVPALTSLLGMSDANISVMLDEYSFCDNFRFPSGCQFVDMIRQVQIVHPSMAVDIDPLNALTLSLGNASIRIYWNLDGIGQCGDENCALCPTFYPSFLSLLRSRAQVAARDSVAAQDFPNWQVDRCKLDKVVDDLNGWTFDPTFGEDRKLWRALSLEENDSITIRFETDKQMMEHHLFSITVSCGQCLTNRCLKCVQ